MAGELPKFGKSATDLRYVLKAGESARTLAKRGYKIVLDDGQVIQGVTDEHGRTELAEKDQMRIAEIEIDPFEGG